ncbi:arrestin domain-containing protein 2 isoform X2 [Anabrus simplex]|uniref:arrestin domain-containing protein 2 isoform X2 n=1 Tax=Anabrus simplex TaxID=316456 RepID=UPI0035A33E9E
MNCNARGQDLTLPVERHIFPFSTVLPPGLPSSFEGKYGHVRYTIKVTLDRPWKFNHEAKAIFTVIQHLDLNTELNVKEPVQLSADKYLCCLWCRSGPILAVLTLPATGYVSGQEIPMDMKVDNASNKSVEVIAHLLQTVHFYAHGKSLRTVMKLCEINIGSVTGHGSGSWLGRLKIPAAPPSFLRNCHIIDINYTLVVTVCISGLHINLTMETPVVIGTVPLVMYQPFLSNPLPPQYSEGEIQHSACGIEPSAPMDTSNYPVTNPPTYEECMQGKKDTRDEDDNEYTRGNMEFAPRYPTYQFQT